MRQLEVKGERDRFENAGVLKAANGNMTKWLKIREIQITTRAGKIVEAVTK